jgi:phosphohistidine phosphatase SixA
LVAACVAHTTRTVYERREPRLGRKIRNFRVHRRVVVFLMFLLPWLAAPLMAAPHDALTAAEATRLLKSGGVALLLRHGQTVSGVGDPPGFTLADCKSQRNLSEDGRAQVRATAGRTKKAGIRFARIYTSLWCRCRDTAQLLADGGVAPRDWPVLNSQFADNPVIADANQQIAKLLATTPAGESWLLVTHQVNIASLTGISPASGEGVLVRATTSGLAVLGRVNL